MISDLVKNFYIDNIKPSALSRLSQFWLVSALVPLSRKWQPTPVFLHGESQGQGSLVGCHLWGYTELDTTEAT